MKRLLPCLLLIAAAFLLMCAFACPTTTLPLEVTVDGKTVFEEKLQVDAQRSAEIKRLGGYEKTYLKAAEAYGETAALDFVVPHLGSKLQTVFEGCKTAPVNATFTWCKNIRTPFTYTAEKCGAAVDVATAFHAVAKALDSGKAAQIALRALQPDVTLADVKMQTCLIGRFSTDFSTSTEARKNNIGIAAQAINGTVLAPAEEFSFNVRVGKRTAERGYKEANVIYEGKFVKGVGGGVCQVSSTLYNAALLAGMQVKSARHHSLPVSYVAPSRDCTVSETTDFTFVNPHEGNCYFAASAVNCTLTFAVYGAKQEVRRELVSETLALLPPKNTDETGAELAATDGYTLLQEGKNGVKSRLILRTYDCAGKMLSSATLRTDTYLAKAAVWQKVC